MLRKISIVAFAIFILFVSATIVASKFSSNAEYNVCFMPGGYCQRPIIDIINNAKSQVLVQAYGFTDLDIVNALIKAVKRKVEVSVILDKSQENGKALSLLLLYNIPCFIDHKVAIAHNKIIIVDREIVIGGSYNYTKSAAHRNAENVTIIRDAKVAKAFYNNWIARKSQSRTL